MKNWFLHILLLAGLFGMLTTSCSQEIEDLEQDVDNGRVQLNFTIVLDDDAPASRTWETNENATASNATSAENAVNSLQILLFKSDGSEYYGTLENVQYFSVHSQDKIYEIQGSIPLDADDVLISTESGIDKLNCKIMALANCSVTIAKGTEMAAVLSTLNAKTFNTSDIYTTSAGLKAGIPMWGITTVSGLSVTHNFATPLNKDIYLLRSMAKIEVTLSDDTWNNGYRISSATLDKYNAQGYVVPAFPGTTTGTFSTMDMDNLKVLNETTALSLEGVLRAKQELAYPTGETTTPSVLGFKATTANRTFVIYVPEYADAASQGTLEISLDFGNNDVRTFKHGAYTSGAYSNTAWDVVRNHYYKYTVTVNDGGLQCMVQDWVWNQEMLEYEDFVSVEDRISIIESAGTLTDEEKGETHVQMKSKTLTYTTADEKTETKTVYMAQLKFKIQTPTGYQWRASLIQDDMTRIFYFAETDSNGIIVKTDGSLTTFLTVTGNVGEEAVLTIVSEELSLITDVTARLQIMVFDSEVTSDYIIVEPEALGGDFYITQTA